MKWDHRPVSSSGKYREILVQIEPEGDKGHDKEVLTIVNNHQERKIVVQDVTKKMNFSAVRMKYEPMISWHRPDEGFLTATEDDFYHFIKLVFEYNSAEIYEYDYPEDSK